MEKGLLIYWNGTAGVRTPKELDLSNIPSGYRVIRGANDYEGYNIFLNLIVVTLLKNLAVDKQRFI